MMSHLTDIEICVLGGIPSRITAAKAMANKQQYIIFLLNRKQFPCYINK